MEKVLHTTMELNVYNISVLFWQPPCEEEEITGITWSCLDFVPLSMGN